MISVHQTLSTTQCVVIVVVWIVSGTLVQSLSQGGVAEECNIQINLRTIFEIHQIMYLLPQHCSEVIDPTVTGHLHPTAKSSHYHQ